MFASPPLFRFLLPGLHLPVCLLALLLGTIALSACDAGEPAARADSEDEQGDYATLTGAPPGGTLVVLADREPDDLNPLTYSSNPAHQITHLIFRTLARRDSTLGNYTPDLAESWELQPDSSTLLLRLRDDVRWHDGVPVTAEDVRFTIQRQGDPAVASPRQGDVAAVEQVTVRDSTTLEIQLSRAGPYTVNALLEVMPVPKHLLDTVPPERMRFTSFGRNPVGNGLFRFIRWNAGQAITLAANDSVPEGRPPLDRLVVRFVPEINAALTELLAGQGDLVVGKIPPDQRERLAAASGVELYTAPRVRPAWIAWNTDRAPVDDVRVRRALLMGIDRQALAEGLFGDVGEPALSPLPPGLRESSSEVTPIPFDPVRARQLLAEAGWTDSDGDGVLEKNGRPLRVEIDYISTDQTRADVLVAIQAMLRRIGVEVIPRPFESTAWVERLRAGEFQGSLWGWGWGPGVVGPNAEMVFHSRSIPQPNFARYSNPRVDVLLDSALVTFDTAQARRIWREFEQRVIDDAVYAPLYLDPELYAARDRLRNVRFRGIEWWEDVPFWSIPPAERLPRDRAGSDDGEK